MKSKVLTLCLFLAAGAFSVADDFFWTNAAGGSFGDTSSWNPVGIPSDDDMAWFTLAGTYTVTFDADHANDALYVDGSTVALDLNSYAYHLDYSSEGSRSAVIGRYGTGSLTVGNGLVHSREMSIGQFSDAVGSLTLSGSQTEWGTSFDGNWHGVWIGEEGDAALAILEDAFFNHGHGLSAFGIDSDATIEVNGQDSYWYVDGQFDMSIFGRTSVTVDNGGLAEFGKLTMALEPNSLAEIMITGQSHESELQLHSFWENSLALGFNGSASIAVFGSKIWNQGTMTIAENVGSSGRLEIHEGSWVDCRGSLAVGGNFDRAGGTARIELIDDTPGNETGVQFNVTQNEGENMKVWPGGTISLDGGEIIAQYGSNLGNPIILQGGTLEGNGMLWAYLENRGGVVAPTDEYDGNRLSVGYDYTQDAAGTFKVVLRSGEHYPALQVDNPSFGQANLDGMLDVDLAEGYIPDYGNEFYIILAAGVNGTFSNAVSQYVFENGSFDVIYNEDSVVLTHYSSSPICPQYPMADLNKDCRVNISDFAIFAAQWLDCNLQPQSACPGQMPL